ncbi:hypothetical protein HYU40_05145 [Candidatus Woesearchaeota archaeon]|nr:hypothetical protein [Candidatus Woesearchaeota archaeon]
MLNQGRNHLSVSVELPLREKQDIAAAIAAIRQTKTAASSYCIPNYHAAKINTIAAARQLSKYSANLVYTQVCRNIKTIAAANEAIAAVARIKGVKTILAVTGDKASGSDISIFNLICSIDKKRFKVAAAVVFTRKNEAERIARKAAAGATLFCTQPVFRSNWKELATTLKPLLKIKCEVRIGVLIPFSAATCRAIVREKPGLITDSGFIAQLAAAEKKSGRAAYAATVRLARENLQASMKTAAAVNNAGSELKVIGIHLYGLTNRAFGSGKQKLAVTAAELLEKVLN